MENIVYKQKDINYQEYYQAVKRDFDELKKEYPFSTIYLPPTSLPICVSIRVVAVNIKILQITSGDETDFLGKYSRELKLEVPFDYLKVGCNVYGGEWIQEEMIHEADRHFYEREKDGTRLLCVGAPKSFQRLRNVILENVKTAENMLIAYELVQKGKRTRVELIGYAHGTRGEMEYEKDRRRYESK